MAQQSSLSGRYVRYKAGTAQLIDWLARTASSCCDITQIVPSLNAGSTGSRNMAPGATIELRTMELVELADAIAVSQPPAPIPSYILEVTKAVIHSRQNFADMYAARSMKREGDTTDSDKTHQYFVKILQQVQSTLGAAHARLLATAEDETALPKQPVSKTQKKKKAKATTFDDGLSNRFAGLGVEEPAEADNETQHNHEHASTTTIDLSKVSFKLQKQECEREFALWCHLEDLHDVRKLVRDTWTQYSKGEVSFLLASMTTDVAFGLLKCADEQFVALEPSLDTYDKILDMLSLKILTAGTWCHEPTCFLVNTDLAAGQRARFDRPDIVDLLCPMGATLLDMHLDRCDFVGENVMNYRDGKPVEAEPKGAFEWARHHGFGRAVMNDTCSFLSFKSVPARLGEFELGLKEIFSTRERRTWLVVACQVYFEVFDLLEVVGPTVGLTVLRRALSECKDTESAIEGYRNDYPDVLPFNKNTVVGLEKAARDAAKGAEFLTIAPGAFNRGERHSPDFDSQLETMRRLNNSFVGGLERCFPINAGGAAYWLKMVMLEQDCQLANHELVLHSMVYLYKTVQRLGLLSCDWPDMDFFIASQASTGPLVPKLASDCKITEIFARFQAAIGLNVKVSNLLNMGIRPKLWERGKPVRVGAEFTARLVQELRWSGDEGVASSVSKPIEIILHQITSKQPSSSPSQKPKFSKCTKQREMFCPSELLQTFKKVFTRDEPTLNFKHIGLWIECARMFDRMFAAYSWRMSDVPPKALKQFRNNCGLATYNLLLRASERQHSQALIADSAVADAAKVMNSYIKEHGKDFIKQAFDQSSGRVPKHLRPLSTDKYREQMERKQRKAAVVQRAGSSVAFSGKLIALYHPRLTQENLEAAMDSRARTDGIILPGFMVDRGESSAKERAEQAEEVWTSTFFEHASKPDSTSLGEEKQKADEVERNVSPSE